MNLDRFTIKAQETITNCRTVLSRFGQSQVSPEILLISMLEQQDGLARRILERLQVKVEPVIEDLSRYLQNQPKGSALSSANELHVTSKLMSMFEDASKEAERLKDQYISVEHLLI